MIKPRRLFLLLAVVSGFFWRALPGPSPQMPSLPKGRWSCY